MAPQRTYHDAAPDVKILIGKPASVDAKWHLCTTDVGDAASSSYRIRLVRIGFPRMAPAVSVVNNHISRSRADGSRAQKVVRMIYRRNFIQ